LALEILRKLRWVLYPSVFILVFLLASYCSFPRSVLRLIAESSITHAALGITPSSRALPSVKIKDISLWRLSGVDIKGLSLEWPATKTQPPLAIFMDRFKGRTSIAALLSGANTIITDIKLYDGLITSDLRTNKNKNITNLDIEASKLDLSKIDMIQALVGSPLQGILNLFVDLKAASQLSKDGTGLINLKVDNAIFGPGHLNLPPGNIVSSITVPTISLGTLNANFSLDKGQLESKNLSLNGGDLEGEMQVAITLGRIPLLSRLNARGWFSLKKEFINNNETIKMLFDLIPELRFAKAGSGKVNFSIGGTLARPIPRLETVPTGAGAANI
jgi:type II secretion system protein N